jgi:hypothetical protein
MLCGKYNDTITDEERNREGMDSVKNHTDVLIFHTAICDADATK